MTKLQISMNFSCLSFKVQHLTIWYNFFPFFSLYWRHETIFFFLSLFVFPFQNRVFFTIGILFWPFLSFSVFYQFPHFFIRSVEFSLLFLILPFFLKLSVFCLFWQLSFDLNLLLLFFSFITLFPPQLFSFPPFNFSVLNFFSSQLLFLSCLLPFR